MIRDDCIKVESSKAYFQLKDDRVFSEAVDQYMGANREGEERDELCLTSAEFVVLQLCNDAWLECVSSCSLLWFTSIRQVLCTRISV